MTKKSYKLTTKHERLVWVLKGKNRREIYHVLLKADLTPTEISILTKIPRSNVHRVIKDFKIQRLIADITPNISRGRLYKLTSQALEFKPELLEHLRFQNIQESI